MLSEVALELRRLIYDGAIERSRIPSKPELSAALAPRWRRRTPAEAQAFFAQLGLTSSFWNL